MNTPEIPDTARHPAFPQNEFSAYTSDRSGLTLRDWFAGRALQSMVGAAAFNQAAEDMMKKAGITGASNVEAFIAMMAYDFADAMLVEREKRNQPTT